MPPRLKLVSPPDLHRRLANMLAHLDDLAHNAARLLPIDDNYCL
jgi:hypothetical protein